VTFKRIAAHTGVSAAVSLAALLVSNGIAAADPPAPVPPQDPSTVNNAEGPPPEEQQQQQQDSATVNCGEWCEVIHAAQQLPPPDFSGVGLPPLADVSVPVSFGLGLPDVVPDIGIPITVPAPQMPPAPKFEMPPPPKFELPPPPKLGPPKLPF
jgi:hypothetical protein